MGYLKDEWVDFTVGMVWLVLGCISDFVVPLYIGYVINALTERRFGDVSSLVI